MLVGDGPTRRSAPAGRRRAARCWRCRRDGSVGRRAAGASWAGGGCTNVLVEGGAGCSGRSSTRGPWTRCTCSSRRSSSAARGAVAGRRPGRRRRSRRRWRWRMCRADDRGRIYVHGLCRNRRGRVMTKTIPLRRLCLLRLQHRGRGRSTRRRPGGWARRWRPARPRAGLRRRQRRPDGRPRRRGARRAAAQVVGVIPAVAGRPRAGATAGLTRAARRRDDAPAQGADGRPERRLRRPARRLRHARRAVRDPHLGAAGHPRQADRPAQRRAASSTRCWRWVRHAAAEGFSGSSTSNCCTSRPTSRSCSTLLSRPPAGPAGDEVGRPRRPLRIPPCAV